MPTSTLLNCAHCGNAFSPKRPNQRFCNPICKSRFTNAHRTLKPNVHGTCLNCGEKFSRYVEPSKLASGRATAQFCGLKCKGEYLSRDRHPMWKGGRIVEADGYVMIHVPDHPFANNKGYVFEHRLEIEKKLGRYLRPEEVVHHKDENPGNNAIDNLELYASQAEHKKAGHEAKRERDASGQYLPTGKR